MARQPQLTAAQFFALEAQSGRDLLRAFQEDLEERPARKTPEQRKATREANRKYELWHKGCTTKAVL